MAKQALIEKQKKLAAQWEVLHKKEQEILALPKEQREQAMAEFNAMRLKKRHYKTRRYNRCSLTGRAAGYIGYFGVCRQAFRELAHKGMLPGVTKSSW